MADIRRLGRQDWRLLREVRLRALQDAPDAFGSTFAEESEHSDDWWVTGTENLAWFVAENEGEAVGLAAGIPVGAEWNRRDCPEIISMWVESSRRGTDVAHTLLKTVIAWAESEGAREVSLSVADGNDRARRFYERAGFIPTGDRQPLRSRPALGTREMRLIIMETTA